MFNMSSKCILATVRRAFSSTQSRAAAFATVHSDRGRTRHRRFPPVIRSHSSKSSYKLSSLGATVPSASETLDFSDLDYKKKVTGTNDARNSGVSIASDFNNVNGKENVFNRSGELNGINGASAGANKPKTEVTSPDEFDGMTVPCLKARCKEYGLKVSGKKAELQDRLRCHVNSLAGVTIPDHVSESIGIPPVNQMPSDEENVQQNDREETTTESIKITSQPKPNGNWKPNSPLEWCRTFGSRSSSDAARLESLTCLKPGDEGYFDITDIKPDNVTLVRTKEQARIVLEALMKSKLQDPERVHACDTEVMDIDLKEVGPVGHGYVTCLSVYSGEDFDYGLGDGPGTMLWVDNLDDAKGILYEFQEWLEDPAILKAWHNYGFDRHVIYNEGINVLGFGGDTMHMARLSDTSRMKYSLESLTEDLLGQRKVPMKEIFGVPRLRKDGTPGAIIDLPAIEVMQRDPQFRENWIKYSAFDAKSTYNLYQHLREKLTKTPWMKEFNMMDYYNMHMRPFGELLTDLERRGMLVAKDYLADVETQARKDREGHVETFRQWAYKQIGPDGLAMNTASSVQLSTFLFGGSANAKTQEVSESVRVFKTPRAEIPDDAMEAYRQREAQLKEQNENFARVDGSEPSEEDEFDQMNASNLKVLCKEYGLKVSGKKSELQQRLRGHFQLMAMDSSNLSTVDDYDSMSLEDLQDACQSRCLHLPNANKKALVKALREDDSMSREIAAQFSNNKDTSTRDRQISEMLEAAAEAGGHDILRGMLADIKAKNEEEPKYIDVTIKSLGMTPEKFTVSGAPRSVNPSTYSLFNSCPKLALTVCSS